MQEPVTTIAVDGQAIWAARMQAGMTVQQLADAASVSYSYVRKLERGLRKDMKPDTFGRLRAALKVSETQLLVPGRAQPEERK